MVHSLGWIEKFLLPTWPGYLPRLQYLCEDEITRLSTFQKPSKFAAWYTNKPIDIYFNLHCCVGLWTNSKSPSGAGSLVDESVSN